MEPLERAHFSWAHGNVQGGGGAQVVVVEKMSRSHFFSSNPMQLWSSPRLTATPSLAANADYRLLHLAATPSLLSSSHRRAIAGPSPDLMGSSSCEAATCRCCASMLFLLLSATCFCWFAVVRFIWSACAWSDVLAERCHQVALAVEMDDEEQIVILASNLFLPSIPLPWIRTGSDETKQKPRETFQMYFSSC